MEAFARRLYRAPIRFEIEGRTDATGAITLVDKELIASWDTLVVLRKDVNKGYTSGVEDMPTKIRPPAFLGNGYLRPGKVRSWLRATWYGELASECREQRQ